MANDEREAENRRVLEAAGYVWDDQMADWSHPKSGRTLDGGIAAALTAEQLAAWLADGDGRPR